jgi:hypothetical protein
MWETLRALDDAGGGTGTTTVMAATAAEMTP